jgi:hypothetical protein
MYINPNLINKKLEDAPPGSEDDKPEIKNILVLLDCSSSMGAKEFKQVIEHLDTMFRVRNFNKVNFHLFGWGNSNVNSVAGTYKKVKGRLFRKTIMTYKAQSWATYLLPALILSAQKVKHPDAILILTDAEITPSEVSVMTSGKTPESKIAQQYVKKNKDRIIWVLTNNARPENIKPYDPTAVAKKRYVKFKKTS